MHMIVLVDWPLTPCQLKSEALLPRVDKRLYRLPIRRQRRQYPILADALVPVLSRHRRERQCVALSRQQLALYDLLMLEGRLPLSQTFFRRHLLPAFLRDISALRDLELRLLASQRLEVALNDVS